MKTLLFIAIMIVTFIVLACQVDAGKAMRILQGEGCTQIALQGHPFFGCGKDDQEATEFTCVRNGMNVEGLVCGGPFKGYTVRYK